jgi:hypothetical protein
MENKKQSAFASAISPGIIISAALTLYSLVLFLLDVSYDSKLTYLSYLILAFGLFWAIFSYRNKQEGGFITYGEVFKYGFFVGLVISIIVGIYTFIYVKYINPGIIDDIMVKAEEDMLTRNPNMSDEQIEKGLSYVEMFTSPVIMAVFGFFGNLVASTVISLIIAIFAKRKKKEEISVE